MTLSRKRPVVGGLQGAHLLGRLRLDLGALRGGLLGKPPGEQLVQLSELVRREAGGHYADLGFQKY